MPFLQRPTLPAFTRLGLAVTVLRVLDPSLAAMPLVRVVSRHDPVPPQVTEFAKAALGWRRVDAELAEILADSALTGAAAGTRSGAQGPRSVSLRAEALTLDLQSTATATPC